MCVHEYKEENGKQTCIHCGKVPPKPLPPYDELLRENEWLKSIIKHQEKLDNIE